MTNDQLRNINIAEWHARESILRAAAGQVAAADHHLVAARESLRNAETVFVASWMTADDVASLCADIKDASGLVVGAVAI